MSYSMPVKKVSMRPFLVDFQKARSPKVTFESLPRSRDLNVLNSVKQHYQQHGFNNRDKTIPSFRKPAKSVKNNYSFSNDTGAEYLRMSKLSTHLDLPLDDEDNDLNYTPYDYSDLDDDFYDQRPQTSYLNVPYAGRNRALESIAECRTPTPSSSSSRGGDVSPEFRHNQILDVTHQNIKQDSEEDVQSAATWVSKLTTLPRIRDDKMIIPVKVKPTLSLRPNERLPSIDNASSRLETAETFLVHSRFMSGLSRADSVESIRTPSTSRHLLWSRGSIMSDGGFPKIRPDTNMTKHSFLSEPTPVVSESPDKIKTTKKKRRKQRRKAATKVYVPFQSFIQSVNGKESDKSKTFIKSANFTLYFPSIHKKCVISPVSKENKPRDRYKRQSST